MLPQYHWSAEDMIEAKRTTRKAIEMINMWLTRADVPMLSVEQIVMFLLSCNNDILATQKTILAYFRIKKDSPVIFDNRNVTNESLERIQNVVWFSILPKRTKDDSLVVICKLRDTSYSKFDLDMAVKYALMASDIVLISRPPPRGLITIIDTKGVGLMHVTRIRISTVRILLQYLQEALPIPLKAVHILNTVYFFDKILAILKPFMNKELADMLQMHPQNTDMDEFFRKYVEREIMPVDYGGDGQSVEENHIQMYNMLRQEQKYMDDEEKQRKNYKK